MISLTYWRACSYCVFEAEFPVFPIHLDYLICVLFVAFFFSYCQKITANLNCNKWKRVFTMNLFFWIVWGGGFCLGNIVISCVFSCHLACWYCSLPQTQLLWSVSLDLFYWQTDPVNSIRESKQIMIKDRCDQAHPALTSISLVQFIS